MTVSQLVKAILHSPSVVDSPVPGSHRPLQTGVLSTVRVGPGPNRWRCHRGTDPTQHTRAHRQRSAATDNIVNLALFVRLGLDCWTAIYLIYLFKYSSKS